MTDSVVNVDMEQHVEYGTTAIESYRSLTHDVIKIYGFRFKNIENGMLKGTFRIEEGLRKRVNLLKKYDSRSCLLYKSSLIKVIGSFNQNATTSNGHVIALACRIIRVHAQLIPKTMKNH